MLLAVYFQHMDSQTKELTNSGPSLVAGIDNGRLHVEGELPYPLAEYVSIDELNELSGQLAEEMFYLLAASKYPGYSTTVLEGTSEEAVKDYILQNFTQRERLSITRGINDGKVFEKYV